MFTNITSVLLVGTVLGQLPATLLLRKLGPQRQVCSSISLLCRLDKGANHHANGGKQFAGAMLIWGLFTLGSAFANNYATIMACRFFIGFAEALVQGGLLYLAFWYEYIELATRAAVLSAITALAGAFGGLVAYAIIQHHNGQNGWMAWRWIFLIEGILPTAWSLVVLLLLPPSPQKIHGGFTEREKKMLIQRSIRSHNTGNNKIKPKLILKVLVDPQWWLFAGIQSLLYMCGNTTTNFLPSIMTGLGYSGVKAQLMSVIPYAAYFVVILVVSYLSDLTKVRGPWILACSIVTAVGYIVLLTTNDLVGRLIATCLVLAGANTGGVISFSWLVSANVGYTFRGSAVGLVNIVVYLVSVGGQHGFTDPPLYHKGRKICLIMDCIAILFIILRHYCSEH
jgi:MFS family permease